MNDERARLVIAVLALIVLILVAVLGYAFGIKPAIDGYIYDKQVEAGNIVATNIVNNMLTQIQQTGAVQISDAEGNTIVLVPQSQ